jgi:hypothetical protein
MASPLSMFRGRFDTASTALFTVPTGEVWIVTHLSLTSFQTNAPVYRVSINIAGQPFLASFPVSFGDTAQIDTKLVMNAGETMTAVATAANAIAVHISGVKA